MADLIETAFARKPAAQWEHELCSAGLPCVAVQSWEEWKRDPKAHAAGIFADVRGSAAPQIGRSAWVASAQPYPALESCRPADSVPARNAAQPSREPGPASKTPLAGFTVIDLTNVVAGPACGRVFVELGATVVKIDPMRPQHSPTIMVTFAAETAVGKRSMILDTETVEGRAILHRLVSRADLIVANKLDSQFTSLGLDRVSLEALNPSAIGVQLSAHRGERRGPRHDYPGYDPALQGLTGIMMRFGRDGCPTFHGIASCVDYLCGYRPKQARPRPEARTLIAVYYLIIFEVICLLQHLHHNGSTTWLLAKVATSPPGKPSTPGTATTCIRITCAPATGFGNDAACTG